MLKKDGHTRIKTNDELNQFNKVWTSTEALWGPFSGIFLIYCSRTSPLPQKSLSVLSKSWCNYSGHFPSHLNLLTGEITQAEQLFSRELSLALRANWREISLAFLTDQHFTSQTIKDTQNFHNAEVYCTFSGNVWGPILKMGAPVLSYFSGTEWKENHVLPHQFSGKLHWFPKSMLFLC